MHSGRYGKITLVGFTIDMAEALFPSLHIGVIRGLGKGRIVVEFIDVSIACYCCLHSTV